MRTPEHTILGYKKTDEIVDMQDMTIILQNWLLKTGILARLPFDEIHDNFYCFYYFRYAVPREHSTNLHPINKINKDLHFRGVSALKSPEKLPEMPLRALTSVGV